MAAVDSRAQKGSRPRLVVLRALGLGDLLTAVPALRALREFFPAHRLILAAPRTLAPLAHLSGAVDEVIDTGPLAPLPAALHGANVAVNLHGRGPQSHGVLLAARPRRLLAFEHVEVAESRGGPTWRAGEHEVARWCRLLEESGIAADPSRLDLPPPESGPSARGVTVVHPGAASAARRWPPERFAAVARAERDADREVVVTGSAGEVELAHAVARDAGLSSDAVLAGRTDLIELAAVIAGAARVVCGDTGMAHLATAFGTPSVVLFGPTSPHDWGPPPERPRHRALWTGRAGDPHAAEADPGLLEIVVADVLEALRHLHGRGVAERPARAA
ncbi:MAG: glycosyltransferase family 9 protein [Thermoleophilaceae bacterium]|nr:glycosyltransferase family 9 protein [Thermoleophilaceae bacterium]